jgi:hypothetical protein
MTTGLRAWVAICAVLAAQTLPARAQPAGDEDSAVEPKRQVAIIDLTEDDAVSALSGDIYSAITASDALQTPNRRGFDPFLTGRFLDEDASQAGQAKSYLDNAKHHLDDANMPNAVTSSLNGKKSLAQTKPSASGRLMYSELALIDGLALLDQGRAEEAGWAMALSHRLDPSRTLDPASYPPDTVKAFNAAIEAKPKQIAIELTGSSGRVWIDFVERGDAPGSFDVDIGEHVITVTGDDLRTTAVIPRTPQISTKVETAELGIVKKSRSIDVDALKADDALQVQRARLALSRAQAIHDDVGRANAMNWIAKLVGVGDAIMISKRQDGKLQWETWRDRAPGFSAPKEWLVDQKPSEILDTIAPPRRVPPRRFQQQQPPQQPFQVPLPAEQQWYEKGWVQISGASVVILAVVGVILLATRDRPISFDGDVKVRE